MHLILDTDIGTDVDDALALAVLLGSPEIDLTLISTVYGDTELRAQLAARFVRLSGRPVDIPIVPGRAATRSGRPVWWPGHEGTLHDGLDTEPIHRTDVVEALAGASAGGDATILAIGPLTNLAALLDDPGGRRPGRVVVMGGDFSADRTPEHNIVSDIAAAQHLAASDVPLVIGGLDLTTRISLTRHHVSRIVEAGPLGRALGDEIAQWWRFHGHEWNTPHDPILASWLLAPELFSTSVGQLHVDDDGRTWHTPDSTGTVTLLTDLDTRAVTELIADRIGRADAATVRTPLAGRHGQ